MRTLWDGTGAAAAAMLTHAAAASAGTFHVALSAGPALELGGPEP